MPFLISVVHCRETFRIDALKADAWTEVSSRHPAFDAEGDIGPVVIIKGTQRFFEVLATKVRPLGKLGNHGGFRREEFLLQYFTQELNCLVGPNICFLYGGPNAISDTDDAAGALTAGLLAQVPQLVADNKLTKIINNRQRPDLSLYFWGDQW